MRQDICWWCFQGRVEPKRLIAEAKRIGYEGFELVPEPLWDAIKEADMHIVTHGGHGTIENGMNDPRNHSRIEDELKANIDQAVKYEIPILICFSGNRRGRPDEEGIENTAACLSASLPTPNRRASPSRWKSSTARWITVTTSSIACSGACAWWSWSTRRA